MMEIGSYAFYECTAFEEINLPTSLALINECTFYNCKALKQVELPPFLTSIHAEAFYNCDSLKWVELPTTLTLISAKAFYDCDGLTYIRIPDSVTNMGYSGVFYGCSFLKHVSVGNGIKQIPVEAFSFCTSLYSIALPGSLEHDPNHDYAFDIDAFWHCSSLRKVYFGGFSDYWKRITNPIYTNNMPVKDASVYYPESYVCTNTEESAVAADLTMDELTIEGHGDLGTYTSGSQLPYYSDRERIYRISVWPDDSGMITGIDVNAFSFCSNLKDIIFHQDAPAILNAGDTDKKLFGGLTITAYYPCGNETWTQEVRDSFGGNVTWIAQCPGHEWDEGIEKLPATVEKYGLAMQTCTICSLQRHIYTPVQKHTHSYTEVVIAPACNADGCTVYVCRCGERYIDNYVDAPGHDWDGTSCTRCDATRTPFTDVPAGAYYEAPVDWALENGITNGATETTYNPSGTCLRAQVVTFLHRAAGNPAPASNKNPFTDVKSGDYFYQPVLWAVEKGITNGTSAASFGSYANCNRAAVVTFLWRAAGSPEPESTTNPFVDVKTTDFFYKPVLWAVENGITNGVDATHFGPATDCNRAQVVTFLYRAYN